MQSHHRSVRVSAVLWMDHVDTMLISDTSRFLNVIRFRARLFMVGYNMNRQLVTKRPIMGVQMVVE